MTSSPELIRKREGGREGGRERGRGTRWAGLLRQDKG
jgi:hypothetical protein